MADAVSNVELKASTIPFQARVRDRELREREKDLEAGNASTRSIPMDSALEQREVALAQREAAMARASAAAEYARSEAEALWRNHKASPFLHTYMTPGADRHVALIQLYTTRPCTCKMPQAM